MFVLGLTFTCPAGIHMFTLFNDSAPSWNLLLLALVEVLVVGWMYGAERLLQDLDKMGMSIHPIMKIYWKICWKFTTPLVLFALVVFSWINFGHVIFEEYVYPIKIQILGYFITGCTLIWIPIFTIVEVNKKGIRELHLLLHPTAEWGRPSTPSYGGLGAFIEGKEEDAVKSSKEKIPMVSTTNNP